jgi:hypothetical protein
MTGLRDAMLALLMAGWLRVRPVTDAVQRGRTSPAGREAALTVRQLSTLLGNALVADMRRLGFESLLILLSSPAWLESRVSERARRMAFRVQAPEREAWARPRPIDVGNDGELRGVPGGGAITAVALFQREGFAANQPASGAIRQIAAWRALVQGSQAFERPASAIVGGLEVLIANGGTVKDRVRAEQAVRREYAAELRWLSTADGQRAIAGRRLEVPTVAIPEFDDAVGAIRDAINNRPTVPVGTPRLRSPGGFPPFTPGEREADAGWVVVDDVSDRLEIEVNDDAARNEGQADTPEAPADAPEQKKSGTAGMWLGGLFAAGLGLTAWTRWRRRHG